MNADAYTPRQRIVICGGHATFVNGLKKKLKKVKYVNAGVKLDPNTIKNSDVVWIQNNCLSHAQYYSIIKYAKQYRKRFIHFTNAGVDRCIEQIINDDAL